MTYNSEVLRLLRKANIQGKVGGIHSSFSLIVRYGRYVRYVRFVLFVLF